MYITAYHILFGKETQDLMIWSCFTKVLSLWTQHVCFSFYVQITVVEVIANVSLKMYLFSQKIPQGNLSVIVSICLYSLSSWVLTWYNRLRRGINSLISGYSIQQQTFTVANWIALGHDKYILYWFNILDIFLEYHLHSIFIW